MDDLTQQSCKPCEGGIDPLTKEQATTLLQQASEWQLNNDATAITRRFEFKNFFRTMSFVNAVAHIANQEGHHPDMHIGYNYCEIIFTTHAISGLSHNDFICAVKVDKLLL